MSPLPTSPVSLSVTGNERVVSFTTREVIIIQASSSVRSAAIDACKEDRGCASVLLSKVSLGGEANRACNLSITRHKPHLTLTVFYGPLVPLTCMIDTELPNKPIVLSKSKLGCNEKELDGHTAVNS